MNPMDVKAARAAAVAATMGRVRGIEARLGVTRAAPDGIKAAMLASASWQTGQAHEIAKDGTAPLGHWPSRAA